MAHPKPVDQAVEERFGWLINGWKDGIGDTPSPTNPKIWAFERLKRATSEEEIISLIENYHLPYEVVVPSVSKMTKKIWEKLLYVAPYMNLLRSLNTFTRHEVFEAEENVRYAVERLTNLEAIKASKVLPFRYFDAWRAYTSSDHPIDSRLADALGEALEKSFVNMPTLEDLVVAIGIDTSGSMNSRVSDRGATRYIDIAGIFTGALLKQIEGRVIPLPFDTEVHPELPLSGQDSLMTICDKIDKFCGGGTAVGSPIEYLLNHQIKIDLFIGITDNEDWAYGDDYACSGSFLSLWRKYKEKIAPSAKAFLITIAPYRDAVAPTSTPDVYFIYGWSEAVLKYISSQLKSSEGQLSEVERIEL
jgi:60 kDa SS-A/Ro ribonucleoprotein